MNSSEKLLKEIGNVFLHNKQTIAVAESVTSGLLQHAFSRMLNATEFFEGGITAYTLDAKVNQLNIDSKEAKRENCVSQNISNQMAKNVAAVFNSDWSIAVTGYASPVPESGHQLFACYSIFFSGEIILSKRIEISSDTQLVKAQQIYTETILKDLLQELNLRNSS